jgi:hypothetical protein
MSMISNQIIIPSLIHPDELESCTQRNNKGDDNSSYITVSQPFHRLNTSYKNVFGFEDDDDDDYFVDRGNGKFEYIKKSEHRDMLRFTWKAIELTNMWNFIEHPICSFMESNNENVSLIWDKINDLGYYGHTKKTLAFTLRGLQYIAQYGEEKFKRMIC